MWREIICVFQDTYYNGIDNIVNSFIYFCDWNLHLPLISPDCFFLLDSCKNLKGNAIWDSCDENRTLKSVNLRTACKLEAWLEFAWEPSMWAPGKFLIAGDILYENRKSHANINSIKIPKHEKRLKKIVQCSFKV